jgi:hypothetical protein
MDEKDGTFFPRIEKWEHRETSLIPSVDDGGIHAE